VEFVEQPVPAEDPEGLRFVYERSALPVAADESCVTLSDIPAIADRCDIANLKLMKTGGLLEAKRMIAAARSRAGSDVRLHDRVERLDRCGRAARAPLLDYADLDGSLLLAEDQYDGIEMGGGEIRLGDQERAGTGARPSAEQ